MRIRKLDKNWDWTFGQSDSNYLKKQSAIILNIKTRLFEWYRDCFFALQNGIPWNVRLGFKNQKVLLDNDVIRIVRDSDGVLNISSFKSSVKDRKYRCTMNIYTIYSSAPENLTFDSTEEFNNA